MNVYTLTLTDFLLARIAEREAIAQKAAEAFAHRPAGTAPQWGERHWKRHIGHPDVRAFVVDNDPQRVLAECEAKRRIVERHSMHPNYPVCEWCFVSEPEFRAAPYPCIELRDLATVYADHPDYRQEWRP